MWGQTRAGVLCDLKNSTAAEMFLLKSKYFTLCSFGVFSICERCSSLLPIAAQHNGEYICCFFRLHEGSLASPPMHDDGPVSTVVKSCKTAPLSQSSPIGGGFVNPAHFHSKSDEGRATSTPLCLSPHLLLALFAPVMVVAASIGCRLAVCPFYGDTTMTVSGLTLSYIAFRRAVDDLWHSANSHRFLDNLAGIPFSLQRTRVNLVLLMGGTVVYVLTIISMFLEAGHSEWTSLMEPTSSSLSSVGDSSGSSPLVGSEPLGNGEVFSTFGLFAAIVVWCCHTTVGVCLFRKRWGSSSSSSSVAPPAALRRHADVWRSISIHTADTATACRVDSGVLITTVLSLLSISLHAVASLPRADVMIGAVCGIVCATRAVRFIQPVLWMLADGDAAQLCPQVAHMLGQMEKECQLLPGVIGVSRWRVTVQSCRDDGGPVALVGSITLAGVVRCTSSMSTGNISATSREGTARCIAVASRASIHLRACVLELQLASNGGACMSVAPCASGQKKRINDEVRSEHISGVPIHPLPVRLHSNSSEARTSAHIAVLLPPMDALACECSSTPSFLPSSNHLHDV